MNKKHLIALCVFGFCFIITFFGGILGVVYTISNYKDVRSLENSNIIESAVITNFQIRYRSPNNSIYFTTISEKTYHYNIIKLIPGKIEVGDEIEVKFNEDSTLFLITNYSYAVYAGYVIQIILFIVCFLLSIGLLFSTISIYKNMDHSKVLGRKFS